MQFPGKRNNRAWGKEEEKFREKRKNYKKKKGRVGKKTESNSLGNEVIPWVKERSDSSGKDSFPWEKYEKQQLLQHTAQSQLKYSYCSLCRGK